MAEGRPGVGRREVDSAPDGILHAFRSYTLILQSALGMTL